MNKTQYVRQVIYHLNCSRFEKERIRQDLLSDIDVALEAGETWQDILHRLGPAKQMAKEMSENMGLPCERSHRNLIIGIISGVVGGIIVLLVLGYLWTPRQVSLKDSSYFDENTVYQQAQTVVEDLNNADFNAIYELSNAKLKKALSVQQLKENWEKMDVGSFQEISRYYATEMDSLIQQDYAVCEVLAVYSQHTVTFTISFDTDMKLAGLYMK